MSGLEKFEIMNASISFTKHVKLTFKLMLKTINSFDLYISFLRYKINKLTEFQITVFNIFIKNIKMLKLRY